MADLHEVPRQILTRTFGFVTDASEMPAEPASTLPQRADQSPAPSFERFFELPQELRDMILAEADLFQPLNIHKSLSNLTVSRQYRHDAKPIYMRACESTWRNAPDWRRLTQFTFEQLRSFCLFCRGRKFNVPIRLRMELPGFDALLREHRQEKEMRGTVSVLKKQGVFEVMKRFQGLGLKGVWEVFWVKGLEFDNQKEGTWRVVYSVAANGAESLDVAGPLMELR